MPAAKKTGLYRVKTTFGGQLDGENQTYPAGLIVPGTSKLIKRYGLEHFEPVVGPDDFGRWEVETATAAPGEKRGE